MSRSLFENSVRSCGERLGKNPRNFALLAEGPLEQLRQLQAQLDEYLQRAEAAGTAART
jgi:hypothetical protein